MARCVKSSQHFLSKSFTQDRARTHTHTMCVYVTCDGNISKLQVLFEVLHLSLASDLICSEKCLM